MNLYKLYKKFFKEAEWVSNFECEDGFAKNFYLKELDLLCQEINCFKKQIKIYKSQKNSIALLQYQAMLIDSEKRKKRIEYFLNKL